MQALQRETGEWMGAKPYLRWQTHPTNARVTVLASIAELRVVNLRMTSHALGTGTRSYDIALVVTGLALGLGVTRGEAQARVVLPDVGDLAPVGLVVARRAIGVVKAALVRILVTRSAFGSESEVCRVSAPIADLVTVLTSNRPMGALERPARLTVVEPIRCAARPANQRSVSPKVLDVTATAVLSSVLPTVETRLSPDSRSQVVVAAEASVRVDSLTGGMALVAIRIPIDLCMGRRELAR